MIWDYTPENKEDLKGNPGLPRACANSIATVSCHGGNLLPRAILSSVMAAKRWLIRGRVQGVGFRYFAQRAAQGLGLTGYVRNLDDGRVEVYAAGADDKLS